MVWIEYQRTRLHRIFVCNLTTKIFQEIYQLSIVLLATFYWRTFHWHAFLKLYWILKGIHLFLEREYSIALNTAALLHQWYAGSSRERGGEQTATVVTTAFTVTGTFVFVCMERRLSKMFWFEFPLLKTSLCGMTTVNNFDKMSSRYLSDLITIAGSD